VEATEKQTENEKHRNANGMDVNWTTKQFWNPKPMQHQ
jgi:hypothetical protein